MSIVLTYESDYVCLQVDPGICGFPCIVCAHKLEGRTVEFRIEGSECQQIKCLSDLLGQINFRDVFEPLTTNPIFVSAQKSGCHSSCPVPTALLKVAEVALGFALKHDIIMHFQP